MDLDHDELLQRVLALTYQALRDDGQAHTGAATGAQRFVTPGGMQHARETVVGFCRAHGAEADFIEYVRDHWFGRFEPVLM
ncbi:MAG: hypothetical protein U1F53_24525 [Burkholderiaceae bacterium]